MKIRLIAGCVIVAGLIFCPLAPAAPPIVDIESRQDGNLAAAQRLLVQAYALINSAENVNDGQLEGHGQKAKSLISQANAELKEAAVAAAEYRARLKRALDAASQNQGTSTIR